MSQGKVIVELANLRQVYYPRDVLSADYRLTTEEPCDVRAIEASVLWHTEGKGDKDRGVHFFEEVELSEAERRDCGQARRLTTTLPNSPLSYDGLLIKIKWIVRVRMLLDSGKELVGEAPFQLGEAMQGREVEKS